MRAGRLRHRVTMQDRVDTPDGNGGNVITWADNRVVWAAIEPKRGKEFYDSQTVNADIEGTITIRYFNGFDPTMRVNWTSRNRVFDIQAVVNSDERDKTLELMYKEVINN